MEKNKIQNIQSSVTSIEWLCASCGNCENVARYQMLPKKSKLRYQKELENLRVNERQ
jgi:hypothetical protein